jgi:hypothetical protein
MAAVTINTIKVKLMAKQADEGKELSTEKDLECNLDVVLKMLPLRARFAFRVSRSRILKFER